MEYIDYVWLKAGLLCLAALVWGFYCEITGRDLSGERRDRSKGRRDD